MPSYLSFVPTGISKTVWLAIMCKLAVLDTSRHTLVRQTYAYFEYFGVPPFKLKSGKCDVEKNRLCFNRKKMAADLSW